MNIDATIRTDLNALASATERDLPSRDDTMRAVERALRERKHARRQRLLVTSAAGLAVTLVALPVSFTDGGRLAWSAVYAAAERALFRVALDLRGKSDRQAESEIRQQLSGQGWEPVDVSVQRDAEQRVVELHADDRAGHQIHMKRRDGVAREQLELAPEPIDDAREPGMTDAQLREKILDQLRRRGLQGQVTVEGGHVKVQIERTP